MAMWPLHKIHIHVSLWAHNRYEESKSIFTRTIIFVDFSKSKPIASCIHYLGPTSDGISFVEDLVLNFLIS